MQHDFLKNKKALVYEDSNLIADTLIQILQGMGASVTRIKVSNSNLSLDVAEADLAIVKISSKGTEFLSQLARMKARNANLRIIATHYPGEQKNISTETLIDVDFLLEKPYTRASLERAIEKISRLPLSGKKALLLEPIAISLKAFNAVISAAGAVISAPEKPDPEKLLAEKYDFAVINPIFNGFDCIQFIKRLRAKDEMLPIFLVTEAGNLAELNAHILSEISYIFNKPVNDSLLIKKIIETVKSPFADRRKNPRKQGISQCWIANYNTELNQAEIFESPFLIDVSQNGLSFQSFLHYEKSEQLVVWLTISDANSDRIIELRGLIRWIATEKADEGSGRIRYKYGLEFDISKSKDHDAFLRMITSFVGL